MQYEVVRDPAVQGNWCVQRFGPEGVKAIASFLGDGAHLAALEYAAWKNERDKSATLAAVLSSLQIP